MMTREQSRIRIRSCGLVVDNQSLLLLKLDAPTRSEPIWMPPGGEVAFGETLEQAVRREVREESGLLVKPVRISLVHQFVEPPWHAVEFYFLCRAEGGEPRLGRDPERDAADQILHELVYTPFADLGNFNIHPAILVSDIETIVRKDGPPIYAPANPEST